MRAGRHDSNGRTLWGIPALRPPQTAMRDYDTKTPKGKDQR
jgi:hypothetical protein